MWRRGIAGLVLVVVVLAAIMVPKPDAMADHRAKMAVALARLEVRCEASKFSLPAWRFGLKQDAEAIEELARDPRLGKAFVGYRLVVQAAADWAFWCRMSLQDDDDIAFPCWRWVRLQRLEQMWGGI